VIPEVRVELWKNALSRNVKKIILKSPGSESGSGWLPKCN